MKRSLKKFFNTQKIGNNAHVHVMNRCLEAPNSIGENEMEVLYSMDFREKEKFLSVCETAINRTTTTKHLSAIGLAGSAISLIITFPFFPFSLPPFACIIWTFSINYDSGSRESGLTKIKSKLQMSMKFDSKEKKD